MLFCALNTRKICRNKTEQKNTFRSFLSLSFSFSPNREICLYTDQVHHFYQAREEEEEEEKKNDRYTWQNRLNESQNDDDYVYKYTSILGHDR